MYCRLAGCALLLQPRVQLAVHVAVQLQPQAARPTRASTTLAGSLELLQCFEIDAGSPFTHWGLYHWKLSRCIFSTCQSAAVCGTEAICCRQGSWWMQPTSRLPHTHLGPRPVSSYTAGDGTTSQGQPGDVVGHCLSCSDVSRSLSAAQSQQTTSSRHAHSCRVAMQPVLLLPRVRGASLRHHMQQTA